MNTERSIVLARWLYRATRKRLAILVFSRWLILFFGVVQVDAVVDWSLIRQIIREQPPALVGGVFALLVFLMAWQDQRPLRDLLYETRHGMLWRQPVPARDWSLAIALVLLALASPFGALAVIVAGPTGLGVIALYLLLWPLPALLLARPVSFSWVSGLFASVFAGAVVALVHAMPLLAGPLALLVAGLLAAFLGPLYLSATRQPVVRPTPRSWRPRSPMGALIHRDLLCLWRTERANILGSLSLAPVIAFVVYALRVNGPVGPWGRANGTILGLAVAAPVVVSALARLPIRLGRQFDPPAWPVSAGTRFTAWAALAGLLLAPSWAAAATTGASFGPDQLRIGSFFLPICAGAALFLAHHRNRVNVGAYLWWVFACVPAGLLDLPRGLPIAIILTAIASVLGKRAIRHRRGHP